MTDLPTPMPAAPALVPAAAGAGRTFTLELPVGLELLNSNHRVNPYVRAERTRVLRSAACLVARADLELRRALEDAKPRALLERAHILAVIRPTSNRHLDPGNLYPSAKAAVDGIVDAGLLEDDDHEHLDGPDMRRGRTVKGAQLVLVVRELAPGQSWPDFGVIE